MSMLSRLFGQRPEAPFPVPAPNDRVWIIGDIHGRADLLHALLEQIETYEQLDAGPSSSKVVLVGDYIDRGDESAQVLAQIYHWSQQIDALQCLCGNHEALMLNFLEDPERQGRRWLRYGGLQTLASYGIGGFGETANGEQLYEIAHRLRDAMPDGLHDWLEDLPAQWSSGNVHVVHAGAHPKRAMDDQRRSDMIWGHPEFATTPRTDGQWVVHGHTITDTPGSDGQGRIAVDTGAYYSGRLTAALITSDGTVELVQT